MENIPTWMLVVAGLLEDAEGRWLMHQRPEGKHHAGLWEFPGGKVEPGEFPPFSLVRELEEELGIAIDPAHLHPLAFVQDQPGSSDRPIVILLYKVTSWYGEPAALEGGAVRWFEPCEAALLPMPPLDQALTARLEKTFAR